MIRFTCKLLSLGAFLAFALSLSMFAAADGYTVTDLGALPDAQYSSAWQQTVNDSGVVAAYANASQDNICNGVLFGDVGFLWSDGTITPLPGLPGAVDTVPFSLNNRGQVVGRSTVVAPFNHAVMWD